MDAPGGHDADVGDGPRPPSDRKGLLHEIAMDRAPELGAGRFGVNALGERGVPAERIGADAAASLLRVMESGASVDEHTADQLIPYLALFGGEFTCRDLTAHAETNLWAVDRFLPGRMGVERCGRLFRVFSKDVGVHARAGLLRRADMLAKGGSERLPPHKER